jgi:hypothetical protein
MDRAEPAPALNQRTSSEVLAVYGEQIERAEVRPVATAQEANSDRPSSLKQTISPSIASR